MLEVWNRAAVIIQIESKVGAENAANIAAVEGGMFTLRVHIGRSKSCTDYTPDSGRFDGRSG